MQEEDLLLAQEEDLLLLQEEDLLLVQEEDLLLVQEEDLLLVQEEDFLSLGCGKAAPQTPSGKGRKNFSGNFVPEKMMYFLEMYINKKSKKEPQENSVYCPYRIIAN